MQGNSEVIAAESLQVLLISGKPDDTELVKKHLGQGNAGKVVLNCCEGLSSGLSRLAKGEIDIVLLELSPPGSTGIDTFLSVHKQDPSVPIIVLTDSDDAKLAFEALRNGAQDYLVKGQLDASCLVRSINCALERQHHVEAARRAIGIAKIGIWEWDLNKTMRWDTNMCSLFGLTDWKGEQSFDGFLEAVAPSDRSWVAGILERAALTAGEFDFDFSILWADGTEHYLQAKGIVSRDRHGKGSLMTGLCLDISERKLSERALRDSERRLNLALESSNMGAWDWDLRDDSIWRSRKHDRIFGYETQLPEWNRAKFAEHLVPDDRLRLQQRMGAVTGESDFYFHYRIMHAGSKSIHWLATQGRTYVDEHGKPVRLMGTITDVTERKKQEQQAREAASRREQMSKVIVQYAPIGIIMLNSELNITNANPAFASMVNRDLEQLIDRPLANVLPPTVLKTIRESIRNGGLVQIPRLEIAIAKEQRYWDLSLWPTLDEKGVLTEATLQVIDRTDTVLLEQKRV